MKRNERGEMSDGGLLALVVFGVIFVIFLGWGASVLFAPLFGKGEAYKQKESATNRVFAQERFEDLYADIKATDAKIGPAKAVFEANPTQTNQTNYNGLVNYCIDVVGDYNADARKYSHADFRSADLPAQIDPNNPSTDCK